MFSMTKNGELDEVQRQDANVNRRHYGEDVKFYWLTLQRGAFSIFWITFDNLFISS